MRRKHNRDMRIIVVFFVAIVTLALVFIITDDCRASGQAHTRDGWEGVFSWATDTDCDSGWAIFRYGGVAQDTVYMYPFDSTDSTKLYGTGLSLDSIGWHKVYTYAWRQGSLLSLIYDTADLYLEGPARPSPATPSGAYVCRVDAYLGDLSSNYVKNATVTAKLDKQIVYDTCADMLVFDRVKKTNPTGTNGYFYFDLIRSYCINGEKYTLTVSKPGFPDVVRKFTVPDSATHRLIWSN